MPSLIKRLGLLICIAVIYFISAKLGLKLAFVNASATAVWPPTGIALASFLIFGYKVWPAIFAGAFLANLTTAGTTLTSLGIALGNTLEGLAGAFLINKLAGGRNFFTEASNIFKFAIFGGIVATAISATIGVTTLTWAGFASSNDYANIWFTWWLGDLGGALVFAPFFVIWSSDRKLNWNSKKLIEAILVFLVLLLTSLAIFETGNYPIAYVIFPVMLWVAFRFGIKETAAASFFLSVLATWGTIHGHGPFAQTSSNQSLLLLQGFVSSVTITKLIVASVVEKSKETDRLKSEFVYMASHELRTPMAAIKGFVAMMLADRYGKLNQELRNSLYKVSDSADRLTDLINDLLDVSRIEAGRLKLNLVDGNTADIVKEVITNLQPIAQKKGIELKMGQLDGKIVRLDLSYTRQILQNLLGNAIKFTDKGSVSVFSKAIGKYQYIYVQDSGIGISVQDQKKIFLKFEQLGPVSKKPAGTGLGLYISAEFARKMDGKVFLESSTIGKGSTFVLTLPLSKAG